jgi:SAM-dependent methyltransferase
MGADQLIPAGIQQFDALCSWVLEHATPDAVVLDVGAGDGDMDYPSRLRPHVARIVGIDPSAGIWDNTLLDERHQRSVEEHAAASTDRYDLAVASYVVEHIAQPDRFLRALHRCLAPGGSAFLITPHLFHYFGLSAYVATRLHVDEWLLHRVRDDQTLHDHHFPVQYRLNSRGRVRRAARAAGFTDVEFRVLDEPGIYQPYLPDRLRQLPVLWSRAVHRFNATGLGGTLLVRLQR